MFGKQRLQTCCVCKALGKQRQTSSCVCQVLGKSGKRELCLFAGFEATHDNQPHAFARFGANNVQQPEFVFCKVLKRARLLRCLPGVGQSTLKNLMFLQGVGTQPTTNCVCVFLQGDWPKATKHLIVFCSARCWANHDTKPGVFVARLWATNYQTPNVVCSAWGQQR